MKDRTRYSKYVDDLYYDSDSDFGNDDYGDGNFEDCGFGYDCEVSDDNAEHILDDGTDLEIDDILNISVTDDSIKREAEKLYAGKSKEEVLETWNEIIRKMHSDVLDEVNDGMTTAYLWLKDFVAMLADRKFSSFYRNDMSFRDDLIAAGNEGIIRGLRNYDTKKGMPTTYFYYPIIHEMYVLVKKTYGKNKSSMQNHLISDEDIERVDEKNRNVDSEASISGVEVQTISRDQATRLTEIIRKICHNDIVYNSMIDMAINGITATEAADKYNVDKNWLKERISMAKALLQVSDEVLKLFPQFQPEGWREPPETFTYDREQLLECDDSLREAFLELLKQPNEEDIDRYKKMMDFHTRLTW